MILWLDHLIFGNGRGMASPHFDQRFYWLRGELYHFSPGLGAQLYSMQWRHPNAGERRRICGREFKPVYSHRRWYRVMVAWSWVGLPNTLDEAHAALRQLERELGRAPC
jgi:hypothetical protein